MKKTKPAEPFAFKLSDPDTIHYGDDSYFKIRQTYYDALIHERNRLRAHLFVAKNEHDLRVSLTSTRLAAYLAEHGWTKEGERWWIFAGGKRHDIADSMLRYPQCCFGYIADAEGRTQLDVLTEMILGAEPPIVPPPMGGSVCFTSTKAPKKAKP